ncbi:hypothetical protein C8R44DRAFT_729325 [Mycena epipterygia]|nr:hypothetical protein C8R44DRAFT_729325 [Mycena epipterygia]
MCRFTLLALQVPALAALSPPSRRSTPRDLDREPRHDGGETDDFAQQIEAASGLLAGLFSLSFLLSCCMATASWRPVKRRGGAAALHPVHLIQSPSSLFLLSVACAHRITSRPSPVHMPHVVPFPYSADSPTPRRCPPHLPRPSRVVPSPSLHHPTSYFLHVHGVQCRVVSHPSPPPSLTPHRRCFTTRPSFRVTSPCRAVPHRIASHLPVILTPSTTHPQVFHDNSSAYCLLCVYFMLFVWSLVLSNTLLDDVFFSFVRNFDVYNRAKDERSINTSNLISVDTLGLRVANSPEVQTANLRVEDVFAVAGHNLTRTRMPRSQNGTDVSGSDSDSDYDYDADLPAVTAKRNLNQGCAQRSAPFSDFLPIFPDTRTASSMRENWAELIDSVLDFFHPRLSSSDALAVRKKEFQALQGDSQAVKWASLGNGRKNLRSESTIIYGSGIFIHEFNKPTWAEFKIGVQFHDFTMSPPWCAPLTAAKETKGGPNVGMGSVPQSKSDRSEDHRSLNERDRRWPEPGTIISVPSKSEDVLEVVIYMPHRSLPTLGPRGTGYRLRSENSDRGLQS